MAEVHYTRFPVLTSKDLDGERSEPAHHELFGLQGSIEDLSLAWAHVLSKYSGRDDQVCFAIDDGVAEVVFEDDGAALHRKSLDHVSSCDGTGVFEKTVNVEGPNDALHRVNNGTRKQRFAVELHKNTSSRSCSVVTNGDVPSEHLPQLGTLIRDALNYVITGSSSPWIPQTDQLALSILNEEPQELPGPTFLHDLFAGQEGDQKVAIDYYDESMRRQSLTYADVEVRIKRLQSIILRICSKKGGIGGTVIPLLIPQSPELYIAMLAILRAGYAFCPLQLDTPVERLRFIVQDVSASLILTTSALRSHLSEPGHHQVLVVDEEYSGDDKIELWSDEQSNHEGLFRTAYVMYTSGSTGQPKGVPVSHHAATQSLLAHDRHIPGFTRFLQFAAPTFDVSIFEIFFTFFRHSALVVCERSRLLNDLPGAMRSMEVDAAELTPTVAGGLLKARHEVPQLQLLLTIGEMLTPQVVAAFTENENQPSILWGMYGPTEAAIHCTLQPAFSSAQRPGNIGFPLDTVSAFVIPSVDSYDVKLLSALPLGFVGELAVGGEQLADGYLNRDEQTAGSFVHTRLYGKLYRTGDKARVLLDGTIECLGRIAQGQVKLRGQRVELGEVRHAVAKTPGCVDAVVGVVKDSLVAFCLKNGELQVSDILESCRHWLPSFMVPTDIVLLDALPRLSSGKVDMRTLENDYVAQFSLRQQKPEVTSSENARRACELLQSKLGRSFSATQPLNTCGIDSLLAIRAANVLRKAGFQISPLDLLGPRTLESLVRASDVSIPMLSEEENPVFSYVGKLSATVRRQHNGIASTSPCAPIQLAMLAETLKTDGAYFNWVEVDIQGEGNFSTIQAWLIQLAETHDILRSGFAQVDSSSHPYIRVIWEQLDDSQIREVPAFDYNCAGKNLNFLRPLDAQIMCRATSASVLLKLHHALYDGWSMDILVKDLHRLMEGERLESAPAFSSLSLFYWSIDTTSSLDYWQDQLHELTIQALPELGGDATLKGAVFEKTSQMTAGVDGAFKCAERLGVSRAVMFQAAVMLLIGTYTANTDVMLGVVTSGRSVPVLDIERIVGPCLASCPLRLDLAKCQTIEEVLNRIHALNLGMLEHAIVPINAIRQLCDSRSNQALWDVLFVWQESLESRTDTSSLCKVVASSDRLENALTLELEPKAGSISFKATFRSDIISSSQVSLMLQQIESLVASMPHFLGRSYQDVLASLPNSMLSVGNAEPDFLQFTGGLESTVENNAVAHPNGVALRVASKIHCKSFEFQELTYQALNERANRLAHYLQSRDLKSSGLIAICMEKSLDLYISILAVAKLGLGYLPLTPVTPLARIKTVIDEANVSLCLSHEEVSTIVALDGVCDVLNIDSLDYSALSVRNLDVKFDGARAAYAVFTSGSTGVPKGVLVTQQNMLSNLACLAEIYPSAPGDTLLQACSQAFDVSVFEIFFAWQQGMCLCSARNDVLFSDLELAVRSFEITHLSLTPTVAALINPDNVPTVKFLVTAGEGVTPKVKRAWSDRGLYQGYGPSETTNICTVKANVRAQDALQNIGTPFRNTSAFVMDPGSTRILPCGEVGELCFGGDQVFRGYINQPDLTNSKIINHPQYGRIYRSGDTGRMLADGTIVFAARLDDQVKIRGQRVELNEVNHCILQVPQVLDCATVVVKNDDGHQDLISFVVARASAEESRSSSEGLILTMTEQSMKLINDTAKHLELQLPAYMCPNMYLPVAEIPMTAQGKIDRRRLVQNYRAISPDHLRSMNDMTGNVSGQSKEWTQTEKIIADVVRATLGKHFTGLLSTTSFLSLGLDSISAIALSRKLSKVLNRQISISVVMRNSSIARLTQWLSAHALYDPATSEVATQLLPPGLVDTIMTRARDRDRDIERVWPCTPLQEAMLSSSETLSDAYQNTLVFAIRGDVGELAAAWAHMQRRHDILRTMFLSTSDRDFPYVQAVLKSCQLPWTVSDADAAQKLPVDVDVPRAVGSFDLPYKLTLLNEGSGWRLQFTCHHALYDGSAMQLLTSELEQAMHNRSLPSPPSAKAFYQVMHEHRGKRHIEFWEKQLADYQPCLLQYDELKQASISRPLPDSLTAIEERCRQFSVPLLSLCQIAWSHTLSSLFGQSDLCFGNVVSGRSVEVENVQNLVAPTFNTIPFRIRIDQHKSRLDELRFAQRTNAVCLQHQLTPLRKIQARLGFAQPGLFSSLLLLQASELSLDETVWTLESEQGVMDVPIILELTPNRRSDRLQATLYHNKNVCDARSADEIISTFINEVATCSDTPNESARPVLLSEYVMKQISTHVYIPESTLMPSREPQHKSHTMELSKAQRCLVECVASLAAMAAEEVPMEATIFQLGLDSIGAIQLAANLRSRGFDNVTATVVLMHPMLSDLAGVLESGPGNAAPEKSFDLERFSKQAKENLSHDSKVLIDDLEDIWPCTPVQTGLVSRFLQDGNIYTNHMTYRIASCYDTEVLRKTWNDLVASYAMLRTGFAPLENDPQFPWAMLIYKPSFETTSPQLVAANEPWDLNRWRAANTTKFHGSLHWPPWAACFQSTHEGVLMHISIFHGIYDATSLSIITNAFQSALQCGRLPEIQPIDETISSLIALSTLDEDDDHALKTKSFWKDVLKDMSFNPFPDLTPLRDIQNCTSSTENVSVLGLKKIEALCKAHGFTIQAVGQATWARILSTYVGEPNVCFGTVLAGRDTTASSSRVAFPCMVTIPTPARVVGSNVEMMRAMMSFNAAAREYQFTKLRDIAKAVGSDTLFDTIFAYQKISVANEAHDSWELVDEVATDEFTLAIELIPQTKTDRLLMKATFKEHLVPGPQAKRLLLQFDALLRDALENPSGMGKDLCLPSRDLLSITPPAHTTLSSPVDLLHQFVEMQARNRPAKVAFKFFSRESDTRLISRDWTYHELNYEGDRVARLLQKNNVKAGSYVGICFDKCPEASFAILGVLKAGAAYVAIDPSAPSARKEFIARDANLAVVLTCDRKTRPPSDFGFNGSIIYLDEDQVREPAMDGLTSVNIVPSNVCYCLYTSGTTGTPKGCEITHENAVQAMRAFSKLFAGRWNESSRWLQFASFHFDVSVLEQYWTWSEGICVVSAPRDVIFEDLEASIRDMGVTHIDLTPSLASLVSPENVPGLCKGVFITGGEQLKQEILDVWGSEEVIHNGYGPTETTIGVTMYTRVPRNGKPANIGPQFQNVGTYVMRQGTDTPVLRGGIGELCISGKLVGKGYLNRPDLTKEKFPYLEAFQERVYRTGDLVRMLHDNTFLFLGRVDDQVKLRGQRLEIGEINSTIRKGVPEILDVATLVLRHPKQRRDQLVAFFVCEKPKHGKEAVVFQSTPVNSRFSSQARESCLGHLPGYMVPTFILPISRMPLSSNNKSDGKILKALFCETSLQDLQKMSEAQDVPASAQEQRVIEVVARFARIPRNDVKPTSNILELGLDSISVLGLCAALKKAGFRHASAALAMTNPVIRGLTSKLTEMQKQPSTRLQVRLEAAKKNMRAFDERHRNAVAEVLGIDPVDIETIAPCTPLQQGMLARSLEAREDRLYFNTFTFQLLNTISFEKLNQAWQKASDAIQILRTQFVQTRDGYAQVVRRKLEIPVKYCGFPEERGQLQKTEQRTAWMHANETHFPSPLEIVIIESADAKQMLVNIFHALYDGNCLPAILASVWAAYHGCLDTSSRVQFHDALLYGPLLTMPGAETFWSERINPMPQNRIQIQGNTDHQSVLFQRFSEANSLCRSLGITAQALVQAAWVLTLSEIHQSKDITFGTICSGRTIDLEGASNVIGPMFNTIPVSTQLKMEQTLAELIQKLHEFNANVQPFQHTPLRDIRKWSKFNFGDNLFDTLFVFQVERESSRDGFKNGLWEAIDDVSPPDYPLALEAIVTKAGDLMLSMASTGSTVEGQSLNTLLDRLRSHLEAILTASYMTVGQILTTRLDFCQGLDGEHHSQSPTKKEEQDRDFAWTPLAVALRREISTLTGVQADAIQPLTTIFELGLDSIDAIKLASRLSSEGVDLPVSVIMKAGSINAMANHLSNMTEPKGDHQSMLNTLQKKLHSHLSRIGNLDMTDIQRILPATPLQEAMIGEMIRSGHSNYYNHDILQIKSAVDKERLRRSWQQVFNQLSILRTTFEVVDDPDLPVAFAQVSHNGTALPWIEHDCKDNGIPDLARLLKHQDTQENSPPPLFQLNWVQCPKSQYLILTMAHALYDGYSLSLIHQRVQQAYHHGHVDLEGDCSEVLGHIVSAPGDKAAQKFWTGYLTDSFACLLQPLPNTFSADETPNAIRGEEVSSLTSQEVRGFCKNQGITPQTFTQACFGLVLASLTRCLDPIFGVVLSGRETEDAQRVMMPTMNTVAFRTRLHGSKSQYLQSIQKDMANIRTHQFFPLRKAQTYGHATSNGLFNTLFIFQSRPSIGVDQPELYESVQSSSDLDLPLCVEAEIVDNAVVWRFACDSRYLTELQIEDVLQNLQDAAAHLMAQPDDNLAIHAEGTVKIGTLSGFTVKAPQMNEDQKTNTHRHSSATVSPAMSIVRKILSDVSKIPEEEIDPTATLYHLGLDSISAIKVVSLLKKQGINLTVTALLRASTLVAITEVADRQDDSGSTSPGAGSPAIDLNVDGSSDPFDVNYTNIDPANVEAIIPATAGQIFMLENWRRSRGNLFFDTFTFTASCNTMSPERLSELVSIWMRANAILRAAFMATRNSSTAVLQVITKDTGITVTSTHEESSASRILEASLASKDPRFQDQCWWRLQINHAQDQAVIKLKIHHALYDGVSLPSLMSSLERLFAGKQQLPNTDGLSEYVTMARKTNTKTSHLHAKEFWSSYLNKTFHEVKFENVSAFNDERFSIYRPSYIPQASRLSAYAKIHGISTVALFLATIARLLHRLHHKDVQPPHDQAHVLIGMYFANRSSASGNVAMYPMVNILPVAVKTAGSVIDSALQVQKDMIDISETMHVGASLEQIYEWTGARVNAIVNWVQLPDQSGDADSCSHDKFRITQAMDKVIKPEPTNFRFPSTLEQKPASAAYMPAIDFEAAQRGDALDVGIFGQTAMMAPEMARELLADLQRELGEIESF